MLSSTLISRQQGNFNGSYWKSVNQAEIICSCPFPFKLHLLTAGDVISFRIKYSYTGIAKKKMFCESCLGILNFKEERIIKHQYFLSLIEKKNFPAFTSTFRSSHYNHIRTFRIRQSGFTGQSSVPAMILIPGQAPLPTSDEWLPIGIWMLNRFLLLGLIILIVILVNGRCRWIRGSGLGQVWDPLEPYNLVGFRLRDVDSLLLLQLVAERAVGEMETIRDPTRAEKKK